MRELKQQGVTALRLRELKGHKLNIKIAFAVFALCPFIHSVPVQAADRADIQNVAFSEVQDNAETRKAYPFIDDIWAQLAELKEEKGVTKVYVSEIKDGVLAGSFLMRVEGPYFCGVSNCSLRAYKKTDTGFNELINISTTDAIYLQTCTDEASLIFLDAADATKAGKWDYKGDGFAFKGVYAGLDKVPACAVKN
jgi:hypothetical protein